MVALNIFLTEIILKQFYALLLRAFRVARQVLSICVLEATCMAYMRVWIGGEGKGKAYKCCQ